jgi:5'-nucleotidase
MRIIIAAMGSLLLLVGCAGPRGLSGDAPALVTVGIIAFNDFHGALEPPRQAIEAPGPDGPVVVPAGGVAYLASAVDTLRQASPNHVVVSAGDMFGASPMVSALFLDEPTIEAMNLIGLDLAAVGNHEFDRGRDELLRLANGGCAQHTTRQPCRLDGQFEGARFPFLAANVRTEDGTTLFPATVIKSFGSGGAQVRVAFIGLTLEGTGAIVMPSGIVGLRFEDEAETVNALVPELRRQGIEAIVVVVHQGARTRVGFNDKSCAGLAGPLLPVLDRLDPAVDVVVSGHTHGAYVCDYPRPGLPRPLLLTGAGEYGMLLTDIRLTIDPRSGEVIEAQADNVIVQGEGHDGAPINPAFRQFTPHPEVSALVKRYTDAVAPLASRSVGRLSGPVLEEPTPAGETALGALVADAQLAATRAPAQGGAEIAFMNRGGIRAPLVPAADGSITYGQLFAVQPFGQNIVVMSLSGRQLRALLEAQVADPKRPRVLQVSESLRYAFDLSRPAGQRIRDATINGRPLTDDATYRVAVNAFLAAGGGGYPMFTEGTDRVDGPGDVEALEAWFARVPVAESPVPDRIRNLTPR